MKALLTARKIRSIVADAQTEKDIEIILRSRKIRYSYTTAPGFLAIRVPIRSGSVLIYKTTRKNAPFLCCPGIGRGLLHESM